jgi:hypothetical protein
VVLVLVWAGVAEGAVVRPSRFGFLVLGCEVRMIHRDSLYREVCSAQDASSLHKHPCQVVWKKDQLAAVCR